MRCILKQKEINHPTYEVAVVRPVKGAAADVAAVRLPAAEEVVAAPNARGAAAAVVVAATVVLVPPRLNCGVEVAAAAPNRPPVAGAAAAAGAAVVLGAPKLSVGAAARDDSLDPAVHAAMAAVCLAMLNLDEALTRE